MARREKAEHAAPDAPPTRTTLTTVTFVCTGNICRSPMAEVVLRDLAGSAGLADGSRVGDHLEIASAGTGNWHAGEPMDPRAAVALAARGFTDHGHVARAFEPVWFDETDLVVCMDRKHRQTLAGLARAAAGDDRHEERLVLLRSFDPGARGSIDVPDPYYGDEDDFSSCLAMVEAGCCGLLGHLSERVEASG
jgi:protein-tyrosine phosphatase